MTDKASGSHQRIQDYVRKIMPESAALAKLRAETAGLEMAVMQLAADQGALLTFLARLIGAKRAIEIGVFTGYSAMCLIEGLGDDGELIACDVSEQWTDIARRHWDDADIGERIDLRLAPARETLESLIAEGAAESFDLAFIDADKPGYAGYYEQCLTLLRPGGLIVLDNMLPESLDSEAPSEMAKAVDPVNRRIAADPRVDHVLLTVGAGFMVARKR